MEIKFGLLALGIFLLIIAFILKEFTRLMVRNGDKIANPENYATPDDIILGTRLELDENGYVVIIPTKEYKLDFYLR